MSGQVTDQVLFDVGDIRVSQHWVVTPSGSGYIRGSTWWVADHTTTTQGIPTWAKVACILTIWVCGLGLLFLIAKEQRTLGYVAVTVQTGALQHTCHIGVTSLADVHAISQRVAHAQHLAVM